MAPSATATMTTTATRTTAETALPPFATSRQSEQVATPDPYSMATETGEAGETVETTHSQNGLANGRETANASAGRNDGGKGSLETNSLRLVAPTAEHDDDNDSGVMPFPEYREPTEEELGGLHATLSAADGDDATKSVDTEADTTRPAKTAESLSVAQLRLEPESREPRESRESRPERDQDQERLHPQLESQLELQTEPLPSRSQAPLPQTKNTAATSSSPPQPRPPPPYWSHSHTGSPSSSTVRPTAGPTSDTPSSNAGPVANRTTTSQHPTGRGPLPPVASGKNTSSKPPKAPKPSHYRDTSSSTVGLITLQDNDPSGDAYFDGIISGASNGVPRPNHTTAHSTTSRPANSASATPAQAAAASAAAAAAAAAASRRCWAKRVQITDYVVVNGGSVRHQERHHKIGGGGGGLPHPPAPTIGGLSLGAFVAWTVRIETLAGGTFVVHKRYSEFDLLRKRLVASFPTACSAAVPALPPKSVLGKFRPSFLDRRRLGLQYFLNCILLNPEFSGSPILQEFLFA